MRRRVRQPAQELDAAGLEDAIAVEDESPLEQAIGRENLQRYRRALSALKPDEHEAIIGRIEMGYTYQELADTLGKPSADAARKATERALVRLAEELRRVQG